MRFGFETASDRVAHLMNKGTYLERSKSIINNCADAGIAICLMSLIGFPGEHYEEALRTIEFLKENADRVPFVTFGEFVLEEGSNMHKRPEAYGVAVVYPRRETDLVIKYYYNIKSGMSYLEVIAAIKKFSRSIEETYTNIDLPIFSGLGHCHTSLYTSKHNLQSLLSIAHEERRSKTEDVSMESTLVPVQNTYITKINFDINEIDDYLNGAKITNGVSALPYRGVVTINPLVNFLAYQPDRPDRLVYLSQQMVDLALSFNKPSKFKDLITPIGDLDTSSHVREMIEKSMGLKILTDIGLISISSS